ncbi:hypothetical protein [Microvirga lotononidis]|uniref:Uncharacterized protein n=1 Tax=Microvirga lotononidis TaxID=864069 RepID=I4Z1T2_9HYPH|nr:hypothetical protein [Microvirga lotononidis]EIM30174.1 hypothetical protein MicloDRAFT_00009790 [Microvirga lotononidis]WQO31599.1 hypothetical protein U0023_29955 [Microvirga lotononidis]
MAKRPETKVTEYRKRAQQARDVALWISIRESREQLLETARQLDTLADDEERRETAPKFSTPED